MMKEFNMEEKSPIEIVKTQIWTMFDVLRFNGVGLDHSYLILLFLSLYKDDQISKDFLLNEKNIDFSNFEASINNSEIEATNKYSKIIQSFGYNLLKLEKNVFKEMINMLFQIEKGVLVQNFPNIFDSVLYRISQSQGRFAGEFIQPVELTRFICGLADVKKDAKVFNPFAGLASFGVYLDQGLDYFGQELNQKTWALGALRLMAYERPGSSKYVCDDSILHWPDQSEKFDMILSNPPFGMRLGIHYRDIEPNIRTVEQFLIEKGVQSLKQNGKLIALLPQGFLFKGMQEQRLREHLVEKDLIDTIISLPGGLLLNTEIPLIILVLGRTKKLPGRVKFVDAKKFVIAKGPREKVLNDYSLISFIHSDNEDDNVVKIVYNEQIRDNDYNLSVARYFQKQIDGVKLGDILELVRGQRGNLPETGKLILIRDLKDDKVDYTLDISSLEVTELRRPDIHLVSESCLLLALRWRTLKPTLFEFKGEPIFRSQDILSYKVNESFADKAYLINELHADYVQEQLDSYRIGASIMPSIRNTDLMEVVIKLPSLEEQRRKINNVFQETLFKEKDKIAFIRKVFNEELGVKQHNIRQHLKNVKDSLDTLINFMEKKGGILNKGDVINPNRNVTVGKRFDKMYSSLENVIEEINTLTNEQSFSLPEPIDLIKLITASVDEIIHPNFDVVLTKDEAGILGTELDKLIITFSAKDLKELINNVVENAVRHGFTEKDKFYKIVFDISVVDETAILTIKNNGAPFPKNISSHIGVKGKKAGKYANQGIGAWKIIQSIEHYGHEYEIIDEPESEFPVGWIFKIKLITE